MKKPYSKPVMYAESYELMEHVAGDCVVNDNFSGAHHRKPGDCRYTDGNLALFYSSGKGCDMDLFSGFTQDEISQMVTGNTISALGIECYHTFLESGHLFAS